MLRLPTCARALRGSPFFIALVTAGLIALAACATSPVPSTQALQAAKSAISSAEQARVADYASAELTTAGLGQGSPVVRNDTATGRQQNRRVEVIIPNTATRSSAY